jgi:hypothetical protein
LEKKTAQAFVKTEKNRELCTGGDITTEDGCEIIP